VDPLYLKHDQQGQAPDYRVQYNNEITIQRVLCSYIDRLLLSKLLYSTGRSRWEDDSDR